MNAKKALLVLVVVFLGFWMFTRPRRARRLVARPAAARLGPCTTQLFEATIRFLNELL